MWKIMECGKVDNYPHYMEVFNRYYIVKNIINKALFLIFHIFHTMWKTLVIFMWIKGGKLF